MSLKLASEDERNTLQSSIKELKKGIEELSEAHLKGNVPRLGAALCDVEFHVQEVLKLLEAEQPFFKADEFRKLVRSKHTSKAG